MKLKIKKIICILISLTILFVISPKTQAANLVIGFSEETVNVGDTVTVRITGQEISGTIKLSVSGNATLSSDTVSVNNGSATVTATITGEGNIRITATATEDVIDTTTSEAYTGAAGGSITVASTSSNNSTNNTPSTNNTTEEESQATTQKSSNANLSNLGIRPNDFTGFTPSTTIYNVTVPEDVENVEVYATPQDSKAKISGTGTQALEYGTNTLNVVVTAEDEKTVKTYTINVTRQGEETEETPIERQNGLSSIDISGVELSPTFSTNIYEYTAKYTGEDTTLDIRAETTDATYTVNILGNEELKDGENIITILVTDMEENNIATYQIKVNKSAEEVIELEENSEKNQTMRMFIILGGIVAFIIIIAIIIIIKRRRNQAYAEEFSGNLYTDNDEEYYDDYDNEEDDEYYEDYDNEEDDEYYDDYESDSREEYYSNYNSNNFYLNNQTAETKKSEHTQNQEELDEKERAKKEFLENYNLNSDDDGFNRNKKRGKRFK